MLDLKTVFVGCAAYLKENPSELWRAARSAARLRLACPIVALRWLAAQFESEKGPKEIVLEAEPPGLRVAATVLEMGTWLRASAVLTVVAVETSEQRLQVELRLSDVDLKVEGDATTPLGALVRSGALDLTKVANLVAHLPQRPKLLVEAVDDRLVVDFMRLPQVASTPQLRTLLAAVAQLLAVRTVGVDDTHVEIAFKAFPKGVASLFGKS